MIVSDRGNLTSLIKLVYDTLDNWFHQAKWAHQHPSQKQEVLSYLYTTGEQSPVARHKNQCKVLVEDRQIFYGHQQQKIMDQLDHHVAETHHGNDSPKKP